jgi:hypothetical protein
MTALLSTVITTPITAAVTTPVQFRNGPPASLAIQANFTYGSGGLTAQTWVQTSFDGGVTWCDVAWLSATTSSTITVWNISSQTVQTTPIASTDGTLASATANDGLLGPLWRCKTSTGTYAGGTTMRVDIEAEGVAATSLT